MKVTRVGSRQVRVEINGEGYTRLFVSEQDTQRAFEYAQRVMRGAAYARATAQAWFEGSLD